MRKFIGKYWMIYHLSYLVFAAILLWMYRYSPRWQEDWISLLVDILGLALAGATTLNILLEVLEPVVLLIPKAFRSIKNLGREGGLVEGQAKERQAQSRRREEAYRRFGFDRDGVRYLPDTQEIRDFLDGKDDSQS